MSHVRSGGTRTRHAHREKRASRDTRQKRPASLFEKSDCLFARDARKVVEELFDGVSAFKVIEQRLCGHARAYEDWRPADDLRVGMDDLLRIHGSSKDTAQ